MRRGWQDKKVKAAWNKWRQMAGILCDKILPIELKVAVKSENIVRPVLLYGSELWALRKAELQFMERT